MDLQDSLIMKQILLQVVHLYLGPISCWVLDRRGAKLFLMTICMNKLKVKMACRSSDLLSLWNRGEQQSPLKCMDRKYVQCLLFPWSKVEKGKLIFFAYNNHQSHTCAITCIWSTNVHVLWHSANPCLGKHKSHVGLGMSQKCHKALLCHSWGVKSVQRHGRPS